MRWIVLTASVTMQMVLGGVYAWSAFAPNLEVDYGLSKAQCGFIFGATIAVFTLAMVPAGKMLQRRGARLTAMTGAILFSAGYWVASISGGAYSVLLLALGGLMGAGIGFAYVCPLTVGMKWFPNNRGLVTGVAVGGFGAGAIVLSFAAEYLLTVRHWDVLSVFRAIGLIPGGLVVLMALLMAEPSNGPTPSKHPAAAKVSTHVSALPFWLISLGLFAGTFAGLLTVGNLKPLCLNLGLAETWATASISLFALGNTTGRVAWGQVLDHRGARQTILWLLTFLGAGIALLLFPMPPALVLAATVVIGAGFGGCFVVYAGSVVEYFGVDLFPRLYPLCFLGYGLAGLTAPALGGAVADVTGSYAGSLLVAVAIVFATLAVIRFGLQPRAQTEAL